LGNEDILCTSCRQSLPETGFHRSHNNPVEQIFWGRIPVEHATSLLFFDKGSKYRHLLHQLKYNGKKEVGFILGKLLGSRLMESDFKEIDLILPVPLHPAKMRRRGFNQSEIIAIGVANTMKKAIASDALKRVVYTSSQTFKGRFERWQNVEGIFKVSKPHLLKNKHILLIDDVVTTGATIEAAGNAILALEGTHLSIATLAYAH
jgi:ComF family protein